MWLPKLDYPDKRKGAILGPMAPWERDQASASVRKTQERGGEGAEPGQGKNGGDVLPATTSGLLQGKWLQQK